MTKTSETRKLHWSVDLIRKLIVPSLSEYKVVGIYVIGIVCALPPTIINLLIKNGYGIERESRIAGVVVVIGVTIYLLTRLLKIYKNVNEEDMLKQKQTDRIFATLITGLAATQVFQEFINKDSSAELTGSIGDAITFVAGLRAFTGVMFLAIITTYTRGFEGRSRIEQGAQWVGQLIKSTYSDSQLSKNGFIFSLLLALLCAVVALQVYTAVWWQIVFAYAIYEALSSILQVAHD